MLVFLHGFLGCKEDWNEIISQLPYNSVTFDLPGHGTSDIDFDLYGAMAKLPPFHLIGYSMGGRIALQYPGPVLSLTLLSAHPGLKTEKEKTKRLEEDEKLAQKILEMPLDDFLKQWYAQPLFRNSNIDFLSLRKKQDKAGIAFALRKYSLGLQDDYSNRKFNALIGENDQKYRDIYQKIPHQVVPRAGHAIHLENPKEVATKIEQIVSLSP